MAALDAIIAQAEAAETELGVAGSSCPIAGRKESGSYYTPADVADHFWAQFFRLHKVRSAGELRNLISKSHFVEPSAGSGIFVFTFIRQALRFGLQPSDLSSLRMSIVDVNFAALQFVSNRLSELESGLGQSIAGVGLVQRDFLDWATCTRSNHVVFIGNPPFVANPKGSKWRNCYADFLEAMMDYRAESRSISLILPVSICFSRDYAELRDSILNSGLGISAASYDNIPDCLFKAGKPESQNTNRANSQRCTILHLGGPDPFLRESAPMARWSARDRSAILLKQPEFQSFSDYRFDNQFPRPSTAWLLDYLTANSGARPLRSFMSRHGRADFSVATVARNFIGIREAKARDATSLPIRCSTKEECLIVLQIIASPLFYEYWRSLGDGFHVTSDLIDRFPVSDRIYAMCLANLPQTKREWDGRMHVMKSKLNSGRITETFDFSGRFEYLREPV